MPTPDLARSMIKSGGRAKLTCVDTKALAPDLPPQIDPCGENGEFHTFTYAGPMFRDGLSVEVGEIVSRDRFVFADLSLSSLERPRAD
jgi:diphthamide synthase (EF-2-diphthine--ammonia ligase)